MDRSTFTFYKEKAQEFKANDYNIYNADACVAHLLLVASKLSKYGIGGDSHSHWVAGLFKDGVYVYSDNYRVGVRCTETPTMTLYTQCQSSCAYGDPWPMPKEGKWVEYSNMPDIAKTKINQTIREIGEIIYEVIMNRVSKIEQEIAVEKEAERLRKESITNAWS